MYVKTRDFKLSIELSNQGQLSFFFLGAGGAFSKTIFQNNVLIIKGNDHILIDCGTLCPMSFYQFNTKITDIKNILVTHTHADHAGGLEELALMNMYITQSKPNMVIEDSFKKILWKNTLSGSLSQSGEDNIRHKMTFEDYFNQIKPLKIRKAPRPFMETNIGSINLKIFRTKHIFTSKNNWHNAYYSVGVLVDDKVIFTGDSQTDRELIEWLTSEYEIVCIFHDCQFAHNAVHTDYEKLCEIMPENIRKKTFLCHYTDNAVEKEDMIKKDGFAGFVKRGVYYDL